MTKERWTLDVQVDAACDFADLFEVKDKLEKKGELYSKCHRRSADARATSGIGSCGRRTSPPARRGRSARKGFRFHVHLEPRTSWTVSLDVEASNRAARVGDTRTKGEVDAWVANAPRLVASWEPLKRIYSRSLVDMAALRFRTGLTPGALPAAGLPWFMAVFGRDSLITSFQAIPFAPELAATTLRTLALFQARQEDPFRDMEPGKILHELRLGEMTAFEERPHSPYYGAADSTMLFLIVLEEYVRWTGDRALAVELEREARAAVAWIDRYGDRDHDGYVEYERRVKETGLDNQCWKDSWDSIAFADGTIAVTPRATCELQGYVYDAKRRVARLARESGTTRLGPSSWRSRPPSSNSGSTATSGSPSATSSRSRSTATSARSIRSPRTSATCSGAASPTRRRPRAASNT